MRTVNHGEVNILSGQIQSARIHLKHGLALGITIPVAFTGTSLAILGSNEEDGTYGLLCDNENNPVGVLAPKAGRQYVLFLQYPYEWIKLAFYTGTVDATTDPTYSTQAAERTFTIVSR